MIDKEERYTDGSTLQKTNKQKDPIGMFARKGHALANKTQKQGPSGLVSKNGFSSHTAAVFLKWSWPDGLCSSQGLSFIFYMGDLLSMLSGSNRH